MTYEFNIKLMLSFFYFILLFFCNNITAYKIFVKLVSEEIDGKK